MMQNIGVNRIDFRKIRGGSLVELADDSTPILVEGSFEHRYKGTHHVLIVYLDPLISLNSSVAFSRPFFLPPST